MIRLSVCNASWAVDRLWLNRHRAVARAGTLPDSPTAQPRQKKGNLR
jgi:hypothetical protein